MRGHVRKRRSWEFILWFICMTVANSVQWIRRLKRRSGGPLGVTCSRLHLARPGGCGSASRPGSRSSRRGACRSSSRR